MMIIISSLLLVSTIFGSESVAFIPRQRRALPVSTDVALAVPVIDPITEQSVIDDQWERCMITAPAVINLLGQAMVVTSKVDVSFKTYSPDRKFKLIRNPHSLRATLLQISNDGYRAFLGAHSSMNRIQLYMQQIPRHIETAIKLLASQASPRFVARALPQTLQELERIGQTCVTLARGTETAFVEVMDLLGEALEAIEESRGGYESDYKDKSIQLNVTRILHADMKREEEFRQQRYEEIREAVRKAQEEYSKALRDIPIGFKALALELGRAIVSMVHAYSNVLSRGNGFRGLLSQGGTGTVGGGISGTPNFAVTQTLNFVSRFAQSLDALITSMNSKANNNTKGNDLKSFKITFDAFANMIDGISNNPMKDKATELVQRGVQLASEAVEDKKENNDEIKQKLNELANEVKPFIAAQELSTANTAPISSSPSNQGDSSKNELFKAQLAQVRLSETERRLDEHYNGRLAAIEQMRTLSGKMALLDLTVVHYKEILEMLREVLRLLSELRRQWHDLIDFFSGLTAQIEVALGGTLMPFVKKAGNALDPESTQVDRQLTLEWLQDDAAGIYRESHNLFVMSRTYYDVSKQYLMGRIAGLSRMITINDDHERQRLLGELERDTREIQTKITELVEQRKKTIKKKISQQRAQLNEHIDSLGADGNEQEVIEQGQALLELGGTH